MLLIRNIVARAYWLFFLIYVPIFAFAQNNVIFEHLSTDDGLSNGTINSIYHDSQGFMWFCTEDGLNRYDGYSFKIYRSAVNDSNTTQFFQFYDIVEDKYGRLWIGTSSGLFYLDTQTDRLVSLMKQINEELINSPLDSRINSVFIDSRGTLWVSSYNGIAKININKTNVSDLSIDDIELFFANSENLNSISNNSVYTIVEDENGKILITSNSDYIDIYDCSTNSFEHVLIVVEKTPNWTNLSKSIKLEKNGNALITTRGLGIIKWDRKTGVFSPITLTDEQGKPIELKIIRSSLIDRTNKIWIGTDGNGLVVYDSEKNQAKHYPGTPGDPSQLTRGAIYSLYEDQEGNIWIGTYVAGLNKMVPQKQNFGLFVSNPAIKNGLSHSCVTSFCEDSEKKIWIGTDGGGLNCFDPATGKFTHIKKDLADKDGLTVNVVMALYCDPEDNIWIGTYNGGLNIYNQKTKKFRHYRFNADDTTTISSDHPWGFVRDRWGNMWVATVNYGLNLMKPGESKFIRYGIANSATSGFIQLMSDALTHMFIDSKDRLWIGSEWGLEMVELANVDFSKPKPELVFKHFLQSDSVNSISDNRISYINEDRLGNIWVGTKGGGINILDTNTWLFTQYSTSQGLPHNIVDGILFDNNDNAWISTNNGLSVFNPVSKQFKNYTTSDGLQSNVFFKTASFKTSDGMFYFGGIKGFNAFRPENVTGIQTELTASIINLKIFNKEVRVGDVFGKRTILGKPIGQTNAIHLTYKEKEISFEFSALNYISPVKIHYAYKLEGFNNDWQTTDAQMRVAKYTNLNPGEYTFCVKATYNEDEWPEKATTLKIIIDPPWWKTLPFMFLILVLFVVFVLGIFYLRLSSYHKQQRVLKKAVDEKTIQLRIANQQLTEANVTKDKFLSIIAHDLINPFSSIIGFSDLLLSNYWEWDDKARLDALKTIGHSSEQLYELLGNLLQWSRSERNTLKCNPERVNISQNIRKIVELLKVTADAKELTIEKHLDEENYFVYSDIQLLNTVIRNLLSNAIKFTPNGGKIQIRTEKNEGFLVVSVIDNGVGMSENDISKLFNLGDAHSTLGTNKERGTGLGLFLVKEFVAKQGGELAIHSEKGRGSNFSFTVPLWVDASKSSVY